jgi:hypothetical protein
MKKALKKAAQKPTAGVSRRPVPGRAVHGPKAATWAVLFIMTLCAVTLAAQSAEPDVVANPVHPLDLEGESISNGEESVRIDVESPRSHELLDFDCRNGLGRERTTLFANGTLRVWSGLDEGKQVWLRELDLRELGGFAGRLAKLDFSESEQNVHSVGGAWVDQCELAIHLPQEAPRIFRFSLYDSLNLSLQKAVDLAREMSLLVDREARSLGAPVLPADYEAAVGDVLQRVDGARFRVTSLSKDGESIEMQGIEQPLMMYVERVHLRRDFVAVLNG